MVGGPELVGDQDAAGAVVPEAAGVELLEESLDDVPEESAAVLVDPEVELLESVWAAASAAPPPTMRRAAT